MILAFLIALLASTAGAICGIGGVIIKPVMDMFQLDSVAAISFLSGCTVLSMSCYSTGKALFDPPDAVGAVQSACLARFTKIW